MPKPEWRCPLPAYKPRDLGRRYLNIKKSALRIPNKNWNLNFHLLKRVFFLLSLPPSLSLSLKTHSTSNTMLLSTWGEIRLSVILDFLTSTFGAKFQSGSEFYSTIKSKEWEHCEILNNLLLHHTLLHLTSQTGRLQSPTALEVVFIACISPPEFMLLELQDGAL